MVSEVPAAATSGALFSPNLSTGPLARQKPVIVGFREVNGHRTSVSLAADKWATLLQLEPEAGALTKLVRELGPKAPADVNRSNWVFDQVLSRLRQASS
jgi:hypothetical protein